MIKCELLVGGYAYDVTDNLVNWDDIEMKWKRQELDGVVRSFTTKFEFCKGGYSLLVGEYLRNYLHASASVVFYVRNNSWLWNEKFRCALDFSTFTFNGVTCEINAIDDSLAALIKAKKGTQYEYSVDVIKESTLLRYDRLEMQNQVSWSFAGDVGLKVEGAEPKKGDNYLPIYVLSSEIQNKNFVEVYDSSIGEGGAFFKSLRTLSIHLYARFFVHFSFVSSQAEYTVRLVKRSASGTDTLLFEKECVHQTRVDIDMDISMNTNDELRLIYNFAYEPKDHEYYGCSGTAPVITFMGRDNAIDIPVTTPLKLLNRLLKSMNGGNDGITGTIARTDKRLNNTVLVSAESIRGIKNAKLYTSYNKFVEWMSAEFGFVPVTGEKSVSFVHRDSLFGEKVIKELENCTDFEFSVDASRIYSRVNVGYEKVDYESVNGKDEFRFTQQYTTGVTLSDSSLDLTSPYRADAYGIEFLASKRGEDTTDNDSDNDVFMVGVYASDGVYRLDRSRTIEGVISPGSMFNVMYSQLDMIRANERYLASMCGTLEFASSNGNSEVIIDGESLNGDVSVGDALFTVGEMSVSTDDLDIPTDLSGKVTFKYNGRVYEGFVNEVTLNIGRGERVTYDMIVKSVE